MNITSRGCLRSLGVALALASPITLCQAAQSGYFLSHVAGSVGGPGSLDGTGAAAEFYVPYSVAVARDGNVFVADSINNVIRKVTPSGIVTTFAGITNKPGSTDGTLTTAQFSYPCGVAFDTAGNLFVADTGNHLIRKIAVNGTVSTIAGAAGTLGNANGIGSAARFNEPTGICVDATGVIYVADRYNDLVRKIDSAGVVTAFKGFYEPTGVAVDRSGTVYVANKAARNILQISAAGVVSTFAGSGQFLNIDGPADSAGFSRPAGVAVDAAGNVYVADSFNFTIRKISPDRIVSTVAGTPRQYGSSNGAVGVARFFEPTGVAVNDSGTLYVADRSNSTIRVVDPSGTTSTLAGAAVEAGSVDGIADQARFDQPAGITVDAAGNLYVADRSNRTIRKISPSSAVTTIAGAAGQGGEADGVGTTARFMDVYGVAADPFGNVYVVDADNTIRKLSATGVVSTFAGAAGQFGAADGPATAARFSGPRGIATDGLGNVYVADTQNNSIRKITPSGMVTTLAGAADIGSGATDGNGASARFYSPSGLAVDRSGNVYVADTINNTIRRVSPAGDVTTVAGRAGEIGAADGLGALAQFRYPQGVAIDSRGNIFVTDTGNGTIRKITPNGNVSTIGGLALYTGRRNSTGPLSRFDTPWGIAIDGEDNLYITDSADNAVRKATLVDGALVNISARGYCGTGDRVMIGGYVVAGINPSGC